MPTTQDAPALRPTANQVQGNFIAYFRLFAGLPGIAFNEEAVSWIASRGLPGSLILGAQLSAAECEPQIDATLRRIGGYTDAVDWFVFPGCRPTDLGSRLAAREEAGAAGGTWTLHGQIGGPGGTWMWADLGALPMARPPSERFRVRQVTNPALLDQWAQINARGFGGADYSVFHAAYSRHGFGRGAQAVHLIGLLDEEPVTSATLLVAGGSASVYNVSTPVELRHRGYGSAITHAALQEARQRGYRAAWIWSSPMGKGVYAKLGFTVTDFGVREYQWQKRG